MSAPCGTKRTSSDVRLSQLSGAKRTICARSEYFAFWHLADMPGLAGDVRSPRQSRHRAARPRLPFLTHFGHWPCWACDFVLKVMTIAVLGCFHASGGIAKMKRRDFIALLGSATASSAAWPLAVGAQTPPKIPRVGFIGGANPAAAEHTFGAFQQRLRELGYVEGQSIALEVRWAEGRIERMPELVAELVGLKMDVLMAPNSPAALAAKEATRTIPIVMIATEPVALGLVAGLARHGGNVR